MFPLLGGVATAYLLLTVGLLQLKIKQSPSALPAQQLTDAFGLQMLCCINVVYVNTFPQKLLLRANITNSINLKPSLMNRASYSIRSESVKTSMAKTPLMW